MKVLIKSIKDLLDFNKPSFLNYLSSYIKSYDLPLDDLQVNAWGNCYDFLVNSFQQIGDGYGEVQIVFEYMLPLEKYRRPDVILLFEKKVVILEFKDKENYYKKDLEQAIGYREDIKNYHHVTGMLNLEVECFLVLTKPNAISGIDRGVKILNKYNFNSSVFINSPKPLEIDKVLRWVGSKYQPLPSIIDATQKLFFEGELPYIKNIAEGDIEATVNKVRNIIEENEKNYRRKDIVFVSGVPGAGKTLVALKTLYEYNRDKYIKDKNPFAAVYLSGNGPLVSVLREQLSNNRINGIEGKAYIRGMLEYKKDFLYNSSNIPDNTVLIFDEAQRAWDAERMRKDYSEAEGLLMIGEKIFNSRGQVTVVACIGDGQSIHTGEEKGLKLWIDALKKYKDWNVFIPQKYEGEFRGVKNLNISNELFLDTSIRANFIDTSKWIESLLTYDIDNCKKETEILQEKGLVLRVTRDFDKVIKTVRGIDRVHPSWNYGLLISSKASILDKETKTYTDDYYKTSYIKDNEAGVWFLKECKQLQKAASEFLCQGLEVDFPIVTFGGDYFLENRLWNVHPKVKVKYNNQYDNLENIINNIYRVILSRCRKGMVLFIPKNRNLDETYEFFKQIGINEMR